MDCLDFNYSLKNIPICDKKAYMVRLFDMTSKFVNRMRWRAKYFNDYRNNTNEPTKESELFDRIFPCRYSAPECELLIPFENDLWRLINSVKFKSVKSKFQTTLKNEVRKIIKPNKIIAFADKTANLYQMKPEVYKKLTLNNITKDYEICSKETIERINGEAQKLIDENRIKGKIPKFQQSSAFVTLKDHKDDFPRVTKCRLINPGKTHLAKVSKKILENWAADIKKNTRLTQWKNSFEVVNWFNEIQDKKKKCFLAFDIQEFYPSIKHHQLMDAIEFAREFTPVKDDDVNIIIHACKTVLLYEDNIWKKKGDNDLFDVPMGSFHGAEICDIVGLHILSKLGQLPGMECVGLYRDDGLAIIDWGQPRTLDRLRKQTIAVMKELGFKITLDVGSTRTDFLDVSLDLANDSFRPFRKPNGRLSYIHQDSNHPAHIKKTLPIMIEKRLCRLSKNQQVFDETRPDYERALGMSGYNKKLSFKTQSTSEARKPRSRKRRCIFFNPPFCRSVKTKIGGAFLRLIDKHFGEDHIFNKIFNRSTVKISFCCMPNIKNIINAHNKKTLASSSAPNQDDNTNCNCQKRNPCPVDGECLTKGVIYQADVESELGIKTYIGSTGRRFKDRYYEHTQDFNREKKIPRTELSKFVWALKNKHIEHTVKWSLLHKMGNRRKEVPKICGLCNWEKIEIARVKKNRLLNRRSELTGKCMHFTSLYFHALTKYKLPRPMAPIGYG